MGGWVVVGVGGAGGRCPITPPGGPFRQPTRAAWDVMNSKRFLVCVWSREAIDLDLICLPVAMTGTRSSACRMALEDLGSMQHLTPIIEEIHECSVVPMRLRGSDGGYNNEMLNAYSEKRGKAAQTDVRCMNHATQLVVTVVKSVGANEWVTKLYSQGCLFRMGGHFHRWRVARSQSMKSRGKS